MVEILSKIISNVLTALYQPFWFAVILSVLFMFFWMYGKEHGWKESVKIWITEFKKIILLSEIISACILYNNDSV